MRLTITDKKFYRKRLEDLLEDSFCNNLKKAYKLFTTEANDVNKQKVKKYCENQSYLRLSLLADKMKWGEDELGLIPISDFLNLYLLIDKQDQFYIVAAVLENRMENDPPTKEELFFVKKVASFWFKLYFRKSRIFLGNE